MTRLEALQQVALAAHDGQVDRQGHPYSEHIIAVTAAVSDRAKPVALFHDVVEDDRLGPHAMYGLLDATEFEALCLLTRTDGQTYGAYIEMIRSAPGDAGDLAREVKVADLRHNLGRLTPALESLQPRYESALRSLGVDLSCP